MKHEAGKPSPRTARSPGSPVCGETDEPVHETVTEEDRVLADLIRQIDEHIAAGTGIDDLMNGHPDYALEIEEHYRLAHRLRDSRQRIAPESLPGRLGRYELLEEIGRGGMGIVMKAYDPLINRFVALKVTRPECISPKDEARFQYEREALARMHHGRIVSIYDTGCDGPWYWYVMSIELGISLDRVLHGVRQWRAAHPREYLPGLDQIVQAFTRGIVDAKSGRNADHKDAGPSGAMPGTDLHPTKDAGVYFLTVARLIAEAAEALEHAHEQGILHGDFKPSNVMVDKGGNPRILDFGVARFHGDEAAIGPCRSPATSATVRGPHPTEFTGVKGTLPYLAPEAFRDQFAPASEVYALGATLYECLTLQRAFPQEDPAAIEHAIQTQEPVPPHHIRPEVPRDLQVICLKSLAKRPEQRYASAHELADDLRRFLAGDPPWAVRSRIRRATIWLGRHRMALASVILLVTSLFFGIGSAFLWVSHKRVLALHAQEREQQSHDLTSKVVLAFKLGEAEQRSSLLGSDLHNQSIDDARNTLSLVADENDPRRLQGFLFLADADLARVRGFPNEAKAHTKEALKLFQEAAEDPLNSLAKQDVAHAYKTLGDLALDSNSSTDAQQYYSEFVRLCENLVQKEPGNPRAASTLAVSLEKMGNVLLRLKETKQAEQYYLRSLKVRDSLPYDESQKDENVFEFSALYNRLGDLNLHYFRRAQEASEFYQRGLELCEQLPLEGNRGRYKRALSIAYEKMGDVTKRLHGPGAAIGHFERALQLSDELAKANPANVEFKRDLSFSLNRVGDVCLELDQKEDAQDHYARALKIRELLAGFDPSNAKAQRDLAFSHTRIGDVLQKLERPADAIANYENALAIRKALAGENPKDSDAARAVLISHDRLAQVYLDSNESNELTKALEHSETALQLARTLESSDPANVRAKRDVSVPCNKLGDIYLKLGDTTRAREFHTEALRIREEVAATDKTIDAQVDLASSFGRLGRVEMHSKNRTDAIEWFKRGIAVLQGLKDTGKNNAVSDKELKEQLEELASLSDGR